MQVHSLFKGHFAFGLLTAFKHAHRIQAKVIQREKKRCRKRTGELKKKKKKARFEVFMASHDANNVQKRGAQS